jgi:hypothetical protein
MNFCSRCLVLTFLIIAAFLSPLITKAQEFRMIRRIAVPDKIPDGAIPLPALQPVQTEVATGALKTILEKWNNGNIGGVLGEDFYDKTRLEDAVVEKVPRDATIRLLSVGGIQTLNQYEQAGDNGGSLRVSVVSVTAVTQIEFNDPDPLPGESSFQRLQGENEYILRITEPVTEK